MKSRVYNLDEVAWSPLRQDITKSVTSKALLTESCQSDTKASLVRVETGGGFEAHRDAYHHVFYFLAGSGEVTLGSTVYQVKPGQIVEVEAGDTHGYRNSGVVDLYLLSFNIPVC